jgi:ribosomal protein L37E
MSQPPPGAPVADIPAVACEACGRAFDLRATACPTCGFPRAGLRRELGGPSGGKSPRTAMWLSLGWPGAGHLYVRDTERGAIFCAVSLIASGIAVAIAGPALGLLVWLGLSLYTAIESGRAISGSRAG